MKDILLIYNPSAGNEEADRYIKKLTDHFKKYFDQVDARATEGPGHAADLAEKASKEGIDSLAVYGGDGTVREVLLGMYRAKSQAKLAIFPGGTANLLASNLGIPQNKKSAIKKMNFETTKKINLGICNDQVFSMFASIGAVPEAIHEVSTEEKSKFGLLAYGKKSMEKLREAKHYDLEVEGAGKSYSGQVDHLLVSLIDRLGNFKFMGEGEEEGNKLGPASVLILPDAAVYKKISIFNSVLTGSVEDNDNLIYFTSPELEVRAKEGEKIHIDLDGDEGPSLPVKIRVLENFIELYLPSGNEDVEKEESK